MEKRGVIESGRTPEESDSKDSREKTATDEIARLDSDFRKRAAETVVKSATVK